MQEAAILDAKHKSYHIKVASCLPDLFCINQQRWWKFLFACLPFASLESRKTENKQWKELNIYD